MSAGGFIQVRIEDAIRGQEAAEERGDGEELVRQLEAEVVALSELALIYAGAVMATGRN